MIASLALRDRPKGARTPYHRTTPRIPKSNNLSPHSQLTIASFPKNQASLGIKILGSLDNEGVFTLDLVT
ncbi:hypothetical protein DP113_04905 [Brasilonema octagenarum UFV-E1]|uniref:Uncharacterized protein n=2 Tax=Brasilonema TaxID=383614 RepID=A0A856MBA3_9CYAN|nr:MULTISPECIES: hypothetical protein [Brasilonema]NMF63439.1 hypothetical protein [Brasilonema octagenarum UFV-OR1]QDL07339.1 hypothetical protein DP114_04955 [Brasilonema sennae CENA114]QDL13703.1 hypothetical protein DP113_04905 [Brasilonema octagenarum UFV-E1]